MHITANREFVLNKYSKNNLCAIPTAKELRDSLVNATGETVKSQLESLFDESTFVETAAFAKRGFSDLLVSEKDNQFESVITGYGAIDGKLVFAFAQDATRTGGVIDDRHARKITDLYKLAIENGAPVIGIFNSSGTDIFDGTLGLSAYGKIISAVNRAQGVIPQIAYIGGKCIGTCAAIASMFDFIVKDEDAALYVTAPSLTGETDAQDAILSYTGKSASCLGYIRSLVSFLPSNASLGVQYSDLCSDNLNRKLGSLDFSGDALSCISVIVDNGVFYEVGAQYSKVASTVLATIGGVKCGIVATSFKENDGKIDSAAARKISRFVNFLDAFSLPVVTLVDSLGLSKDKKNEHLFAPELAKLAMAYASSSCPKVTVIMGHAVGASFVLLGSKSLGADLVYAIDDSEIGALTAEAGVAFAWDKHIDKDTTREDLIENWKNSLSSPVAAAASGDIDDIISTNELRARICSALLMLCAKGNSSLVAHRKVQPL